MKHVVVILLFLVQVIAFALGLPMCLCISLGIPQKESLILPCIALFVIGTLAFILNQVLLHIWDKNK